MASEKSQGSWQVMNLTDGILASPDVMSKSEAEIFVAQFPEKYSGQGYYLTAGGDRIKPEQVRLHIVPAGK